MLNSQTNAVEDWMNEVVTDTPNIKVNVCQDDVNSNDGWETLSIPSTGTCSSTKWVVSKTKKLRKRCKKLTRLTSQGKLEYWECMPLYRIYVKRVSTPSLSPLNSNEILQLLNEK